MSLPFFHYSILHIQSIHILYFIFNSFAFMFPSFACLIHVLSSFFFLSSCLTSLSLHILLAVSILYVISIHLLIIFSSSSQPAFIIRMNLFYLHQLFFHSIIFSCCANFSSCMLQYLPVHSSSLIKRVIWVLSDMLRCAFLNHYRTVLPVLSTIRTGIPYLPVLTCSLNKIYKREMWELSLYTYLIHTPVPVPVWLVKRRDYLVYGCVGSTG